MSALPWVMAAVAVVEWLLIVAFLPGYLRDRRLRAGLRRAFLQHYDRPNMINAERAREATVTCICRAGTRSGPHLPGCLLADRWGSGR